MSRDQPLLIADEGFNRNIIRGLLARDAEIAIVRAQDAGLTGATDSAILEWACDHCRIVLTHDENSMVGDAVARLSRGLRMPGVLVIHQEMPTGQAIEGLLEMIGASLEGEWENQIRYVASQ